MSTSFQRFSAVTAAFALLSLPLASLSSDAEAALKPKHYSSCAKLLKDYPHGVGKTGARDKVGAKSKPVTNFKVSSAVYKMNDGPRNKKTGEYDLDRDNDGVACEKR